jgi:hypothetical protein
VSQTKGAFGLGCLALFSLPFLGVGVLLLFFALGTWREYLSIRDWTPVEARIESADLQITRGSKGSVSKKLSARFRYEAGGRVRESSRVGAGDDASDFADRYDLLEQHRASGEPITAYVDPADPSRAVLFQDLPFAALLLPGAGLVFGGAGAGILLAALAGIATARKRAGLERQFPGRPWRHDPEWHEFSLQAGTLTTVALLWGMALWLTVFMGIFVVAIAADAGAPFWVKGIVGFFCLIPLGLIYAAVMKTLHLVKFGRPTLHVARLPVVPGETLEAAITVGTPIDAREGVHLSLRCVKATSTGSGKNRSTTTENLCDEKAEVRAEDLRPGFPVGSIIPVRMRVPADLPETSQEGNPRYGWVLEARASGPGVDFEVSFDLPVYRADAALVERRPDALPGT